MKKRYTHKKRRFTTRMQARLLLVFCVILLFLTGLIGRLIYLQQSRGDQYKKHVLARQTYVSSVIPYKRGEIIDRNGTTLVRSELKYKLILDPNMLIMQDQKDQLKDKSKRKNYLNATKDSLHKYFDLSNEEFDLIISEKPDSQYVVVLTQQDYQVVKEFKEYMKEEKNIIGVWFEEEYVRNYLYPNLASDVLGFITADNVGYFGIEEYYNDVLNGTNGKEYGYYDSSLNIERIINKAKNGNSVVTTIDINLQRIVQKHIAQFNEEFGSKNIGVVMMDPNNGEILAMASNEEYDLNSPRDLTILYTQEEIEQMSQEEQMDALNELWGNFTINYGFEPGSTYKPFTVATSLEEALITDNTSFFCDGIEIVGGNRIRCSKRSGHGYISLAESLMVSCNDALMEMAFAQGREMFYNYQNKFEFGKKTGIDLPGEASGILIPKENLNDTELATSSFGQSLNVTMIQMVAAYSSLINGGNYYTPHLVKEIISDSGAVVKKIDKQLVRKTASEQTSELINRYMYQTVEEGTAKGAKVEGYSIGGKTGTAQKLPRSDKTYIVSFLGSSPAINPGVVIYVVIDEPENVLRQADSSIATNLAGRILNEALPALGIFPDGDIDYLLPEKDEADINNPDENTEANEDNEDDTNENIQQDGMEDNNIEDNDAIEDDNVIEDNNDIENGAEEDDFEGEDEFNGEALDD